MSRKAVVYCVLSLFAAMLLPATFALAGAPAPAECAASVVSDGTPNLGTAQINQQDSRWFVEGRIYKTDSDAQNWYDNTTLSVGFSSPINEKTGFEMVLSDMRNEVISGASTHNSDRTVLAPYVKRNFSNAAGSTVSLTIGADVALSTTKATNGAAEAYQSDFTPAAKLQVEWGKPGNTQWQLAAQVAFWDTWCATNVGAPIPGFGTVVALGGGVTIPFGTKLTLVGDVMGIAGGKNVINADTNAPGTQLIWSAGGNWMLGGPYTTCLSVYATNAMGPTPAASIIAAPDNSVGLGLALRREF
jgi:hypothetical protein